MKNKFGETVWFNKITEKPVYNLLKNTYPLPSGYTEVPYIQNDRGASVTAGVSGVAAHKYGKILIEDFKMSDVAVGNTLHIDFNMGRNTFVDDTFFWFGSGRFTAATNGQRYNIGVMSYPVAYTDANNPNGETRKIFNVICTGQHYSSNTCCTSSYVYQGNYIYNIYVHYRRNSSSAMAWGGTIRENNTGIKVWHIPTEAATSKSEEFNYDTPMSIFGIVMRDYTYPQYYSWGYNNRATETGSSLLSSYSKPGVRFYTRGKIMINNTIYMYLYACYKNDTHQYGIYDGVTGHFYPDFNEKELNIFGTNPNYYWEHIATAPGATRQEKEATFLNVFGPKE